MARKTKHDDEMRSHYDFSGGVRGKYAAYYAQGTNVVVLAPDVAEVFPGTIAVNEARREQGMTRKIRSDIKVGTLEKKLGLKSGAIRNPDGSDARSDKRLGTLRKEQLKRKK